MISRNNNFHYPKLHELVIHFYKSLAKLLECHMLGIADAISSKNIAYSSTKGNEVVYKSTKQSIFLIGYQALHLSGSSRKNDRKTWFWYFDELSIFSSAHTDCFMVEPLSQNIGVIAMF